jgi:hypothetical protein
MFLYAFTCFGLYIDHLQKAINGPEMSKTKYMEVILGQFFPELTEEERLYGWFQQDSATAYIA